MTATYFCFVLICFVASVLLFVCLFSRSSLPCSVTTQALLRESGHHTFPIKCHLGLHVSEQYRASSSLCSLYPSKQKHVIVLKLLALSVIIYSIIILMILPRLLLLLFLLLLMSYIAHASSQGA